jgi:hypothetical protein
MKEIAESRKLLGATASMSMKELDGLYKGLMKKHHPDRFQDELERIEAEEISQRIISAYKFLQGIHPETHASRAEEFERTFASGVLDWEYKAQILNVHFADGSKHAFYGVTPNTYNKFVASNGTPRFVRRNLVGTFAMRRLNGPTGVLAA